MNKKAVIPLVIWGVVILIGLIVSFFILRGITQLIMDITMWILILSLIIFGLYAVYKIVGWMSSPKKR